MARVLLAGSVGLIVAETLWPFNVRGFHILSLGQYVHSFEQAPSSLVNLPQNVLLFLPFGFSVASLLVGPRSKISSLALTILAGFLLSWSIESCQIFLPNRVANLADVAGNTLGSGAGWLACRAWQLRDRTLQSRIRIAATFLTYCVLASLAAWALMVGMRPALWDPTYPTSIGHDPGGSSWKGAVSDVVVLDRALDEPDAVELLSGKLPRFASDAVVCAFTMKICSRGSRRGGR